MKDAFPLAWPTGWPRTPRAKQRPARFARVERSGVGLYRSPRDLTVAEGVGRVRNELRTFGVLEHTVVISTNVELRRDGWPRSERGAPADVGVAVYWADRDSGAQQCMAIDIYATVAGNLGAVAATISAMRAIERHGGAQILMRAFQGFKALPASTTPALSAREAAAVVARRSGADDEDTVDLILDDREWAKEGVRRAVKRTHPDSPDRTDRGGSTDDYMLVQEAKRVLEAHHGVTL